MLKTRYKKIMKENNDYIKINNILGTQLKEKENEKEKLEKYHKEHIKILENNVSNLELIINKSKIIKELNERINDYIKQISIKEKQINALMKCLEEKSNENNDKEQKIEYLLIKLNEIKNENQLKEKQIEELKKDNNEIKCKNLLQKYDENIGKNETQINQLLFLIKIKDKKIEKFAKINNNLEQIKY